MFKNATSFNKELGTWNVASATHVVSIPTQYALRFCDLIESSNEKLLVCFFVIE
jgi:hypothetical protein